MVNKTFQIPLDLKQPSASYGVKVVEGDSGNIFIITLTDDGTAVNLTGCRVLAVFSRPDGATVEQDSDGHGVTIGGTGNNIVTISLYTGSFGPGTVTCELQAYSGSNQETLITSAQFTFECRRSIMNSETIQSEENYPILVGLIEQVNKMADAAQSDWNKTDTTDPAYIQNKPTAMAPTAHAASHGSGGADPITPASIGAMASGATPTPAAHAASHAPGAADPLTGYEQQRLQFANVVVPAASFVTYTASGTEETALYAAGYTYRAPVALAGVLATMTPDIDPSIDLDECGATIWRQAQPYNGGIYLYADGAPSAAFTLVTIILWKAVS